MKVKAYSLALIMVIACFAGVFSGCGSSNNEAFAENVAFELNTVNARVGDKISLEDNAFNIFPTDLCTNSCSFSSSNPQIADVNAITGEVTCLNKGTVIIYGRVKISDDKFIGDSFTLIINEALVYANNFSLQYEGELTVGYNAEVLINAITIEGENVNVMPTVSYSSAAVVSYDYTTGQINTIGLGSTTVYVTLELKSGEQLTKQFKVFVVEQILYIDTQLTYQKNINEFFYISYTIIDNTKDNNLAEIQLAYVQILTTNNLIEIVQQDFGAILIKTLASSGTAILRLTYVGDETVTKDVGITIN